MSIDELRDVGLEEMDDAEIANFLASQGVGVLGLPAADGPYLLPMSFGYDGGDTLYFTFVLGETSAKEEATEAAETARFLVYSAKSLFTWQSVLLTGTVERVPESEWDAVEDTMENAWHPDLLQGADLSRGVRIYRFHVDERTGYKHTGTPPGFDPDD
jgi:hypothetical protein